MEELGVELILKFSPVTGLTPQKKLLVQKMAVNKKPSGVESSDLTPAA